MFSAKETYFEIKFAPTGSRQWRGVWCHLAARQPPLAPDFHSRYLRMSHPCNSPSQRLYLIYYFRKYNFYHGPDVSRAMVIAPPFKDVICQIRLNRKEQMCLRWSATVIIEQIWIPFIKNYRSYRHISTIGQIDCPCPKRFYSPLTQHLFCILERILSITDV